jgi:hypothetical protein
VRRSESDGDEDGHIAVPAQWRERDDIEDLAQLSGSPWRVSAGCTGSVEEIAPPKQDGQYKRHDQYIARPAHLMGRLFVLDSLSSTAFAL